MSWRRAWVWLALFAVLAVVGARGLWPAPRAADPVAAGRGEEIAARVTRVVDGDTIKVSIAGQVDTVRYIGVDTPETRRPGTPIECFGKAASAHNRRLVEGREVVLGTDAEPRDRYGRLLAYVHRRPDGLFVNAALVRDGYATILTIPPNVRHAGRLLEAERAARRRGAGLWSACG
jgi:micrococcal nuclease